LRTIIAFLQRVLGAPNPEKTDTTTHLADLPDRSSMADFARILQDHDRRQPDRNSAEADEG
jgi:hypothetical protein